MMTGEIGQIDLGGFAEPLLYSAARFTTGHRTARQ